MCRAVRIILFVVGKRVGPIRTSTIISSLLVDLSSLADSLIEAIVRIRALVVDILRGLVPELSVLRALDNFAYDTVLGHDRFVRPLVLIHLVGDFKSHLVARFDVSLELVLNSEVRKARVLLETRLRDHFPFKSVGIACLI